MIVVKWLKFFIFFLWPISCSAEIIGKAALVINEVTGKTSVNQRFINTQSEVFKNERITTHEDSKTQLIFQDQSVLSIGPNSEVVLDSFVYDGDKGALELVVSLTKGLFRFASGVLPANAYTVQTPTTIIGIRGTALDVYVSENGATAVTLLKGTATVKTKNLTKNNRIRQLKKPNTFTAVLSKESLPLEAKPQPMNLKEIFKNSASSKSPTLKSDSTKDLRINFEEKLNALGEQAKLDNLDTQNLSVQTKNSSQKSKNINIFFGDEGNKEFGNSSMNVKFKSLPLKDLSNTLKRKNKILQKSSNLEAVEIQSETRETDSELADETIKKSS
tara:strand:- start:309 stop:1301 length:993 start_codon:yes stop_codon:yes gene_type:complete